MKMRATPQELAIIKHTLRQETVPRVQKRLRALYLFLSGKTCQETAEIIGMTAATVSNINRTYKQSGLGGLPGKSIPGRPSRLSPPQQEQLRHIVLEKLPKEVGLCEKANWTAELIGNYIFREFGYRYSIRGITRMLEHMGIVYIRPHYMMAESINPSPSIRKSR
jgi:putative transposase